MRFLHGKVKARKGDVIKISISQPTRILVMTKVQYKRYANNRTFTYFGGQKDGGYDFSVPKDGYWHIIVEKGSYRSPMNIETTVIKEQGVLPAAPDKKSKKKDKKKKKKELEAAAEAVEATEDLPTEDASETAEED